MDVATSSRLNSGQGSHMSAMAMEQPRLTKMDSASVRLFLRVYDQCARKVQERARRLVVERPLPGRSN